ncbi:MULTISPECIES: phosphotransacetylase [unclassified Rhodococcus (in: high G+C Gram-positive bacteria)]|uniref:phosphotransacetylase n=1 Tax=unclassified Rhodococcus (in: high G+C Gram-positive bacteria) TaxID=192944 RepID=UPI0031407B63
MLNPEREVPTPHSALSKRWFAQLSGRNRVIGFADGEDERTIRAAHALNRSGVVTPRLYGRREAIHVAARDAGSLVPEEWIADVVEGVDDVVREVIAASYAQEPHRIAAAQTDPIHIAAAATRAGIIDGCVAGATRSTSDVLRAGLRIVRLEPDTITLSSCFLMLLPNGRAVTFADCAVVPEPSVTQLADITLAACATHSELTGQSPVAAMLSFSTQGSAQHPRVDRVRQAAELVRERDSELHVDGDLQFDAALVQEVAITKAPGSTVAGRANVFIFPNLDAGNIGYKIAQRLGRVVALGPILQGLNAPINDLSRGCSSSDIELMALVTAIQSLAI